MIKKDKVVPATLAVVALAGAGLLAYFHRELLTEKIAEKLEKLERD